MTGRIWDTEEFGEFFRDPLVFTAGFSTLTRLKEVPISTE